MLKRGRENIPESLLKHERFEVPKVRGHIQGNKTVISNFHQIASALGRDIHHVVKYILKELATPGDLTKTALMLGRKISASQINEKIQSYVDAFVLCGECKSPDTKLVTEQNITFIRCQACGAHKPVKTEM